MFLNSLMTVALVVNELMASNVGTVMSPATNFDSWIEVYNPSDEEVNLAGMYMSDDASNLTLWHLPQDIGSVPAKGFKVIWLGSNNIKTTQAPFKLDCDGGTIYLSDQNGNLIFSQDYPEAMSRTAYARKVDGTGEWGWTADATPGESNASAVFADRRLDPPVVGAGSKIFTSSLSFDVTIPEGAKLVYTTDGSLPILPKEIAEGQEWINFVINSDCEGTDVTSLVGKDGNAGGAYETHIVDGAGYDGSRGVKVHSVNNPQQSWDTQFFVYTPDHVWNAGDRYRFRMKVRADQPANISVQSHTTPGSYIHWAMLDGNYNVTTEWQEIVFDGTVTPEQAGFQGMQTIAFNLNESRRSNNYYFDDIYWEAHNGDVESSGTVSADGHFKITQTTNFCFRLYQDGYLPSVPVTRSYIKTNNKYTIPVISIVGNKKYFTDNKWGIDTKGNNGRTGNGQETKCNWNMDWDRPVNFSFITPEGVMAYNQDVDICVSGGWTRSATPRSFKLKSGKEFDGQNRFDYAFFPQKPYIRNKVLLVRNGGNDVWENNGSRFLDPALQTIIQRSGINLDLQSYVPVIEYVNGEFRGVLNMREPNNNKFVDANYGYDSDFIDMFEMSADSNVVFMQGNSQVLERIYELGAHSTEPGAYDELKQILDIDEFVNYMAVELFLGSSDWPHNNIKGFRSHDNGRYRFVTFDLDFAFKNSNPFTAFQADQWHTFNFIYDLQESRYEEIKIVTFFLNMLKNEEFRKLFIDTYCLIGGSVFEKNKAVAIVDELADVVRPMMQLDGWHSPDGSANLIKSKLNNLNESMMTCMQAFAPMQLSRAKKQKVQLATDMQGAYIYVNGLEVPYSDFNGRLFGPVQLEAKAPAGSRFLGWRKANNTEYYSTEPVITMPDDLTLKMTACFAPMTEEERKAENLPPVRINEVSAANGIYVNDYWKRNDWVELYNTTNEPIDVEGMYLTDNVNKPQKYQISKGEGMAETVIPPHGYLIVWCDKLEPVSQLHASFKLEADGGDVMLTAADGSWSDRLTYAVHRADETVCRYPDGGNEVFVTNTPSIAKTNIKTSYQMPVSQADGIGNVLAQATDMLSARYVLGNIVIRSNQMMDAEVEVCNLAGQPVALHHARMTDGYAEVSVGQLPQGCYIAHVSDGHGHIATCKFVKK